MSDVAATAAVIARVRAEETAKPAGRRLLEDPFARLFHGDESADAIEAQFRQVPFFREQVLVRTRFIDDALRDAIGRGMRQLLLLGAGFDCRPLRIDEVRARGVRAFEVDFGPQLARKREILAAAGHALPPWDVHVACDFRSDFETPLAENLRAGGYDPTSQAFVICEGLVNYLESADIDRLFLFIVGHAAAESQVVFNYARFRLDPEGLAGRLAGLGFAGVDTWSAIDLYRQYYRTEPSDDARSTAEEFFISVATL